MKRTARPAARRSHANVLTYHDVVGPGEADASGFRGGGPARYKVQRVRFEAQLDQLAARLAAAPVIADALAAHPAAGPWALTFDDGGSSAVDAARSLEARGW